MRIDTQEDLIKAVWINANRISCINGELYQITHGKGEPLPSFYIRLFNKLFDLQSEANSFFCDVNKNKNFSKFLNTLNELGGFVTSDILLNGSLGKRENFEVSPVMEREYKVEGSY